MYPLQQTATHRIAGPPFLNFSPACFPLGGSSTVDDLPTILPSSTNPQTPLLPVFPKDHLPKLTKSLTDRYSFSRRIGAPQSPAAKLVTKQPTRRPYVLLAVGKGPSPVHTSQV